MLKIAIYDKDKRQQAQILDYIARDIIMAQLSRQKSKIFIMNRYAWL